MVRLTHDEVNRAFVDQNILISGTVAGVDSTGPTFQGSRTITVTTSDITNYGATGGNWILDVTVLSGATRFTPFIEGKDVTSKKYYTLISGAELSATGTTVYQIHPSYVSGGLQTPNVGIASITREVEALPRTWRLVVSHADNTGASGATYTFGFTPTGSF